MRTQREIYQEQGFASALVLMQHWITQAAHRPDMHPATLTAMSKEVDRLGSIVIQVEPAARRVGEITAHIVSHIPDPNGEARDRNSAHNETERRSIHEDRRASETVNKQGSALSAGPIPPASPWKDR